MHKIYDINDIEDITKRIKCNLLPQFSVKISKSSLPMFFFKADNIPWYMNP